MKYDELLKQIFAKPLHVVPRKDAPDWYLKINDMAVSSPLLKEIREKAKGRT